MKMTKLLMIIALLLSIFTNAQADTKPYELILSGDEKENFTIKLDLEVDVDGKPIAMQKIDLKNSNGFKSLKILTTPGLVGTLADEREIIVYYKTSLNVNGFKIRNLYKVAIARVYDSEDKINLIFDKDHYQNIISLLKYHNVKGDVLKDIDDMYGFWDELDGSVGGSIDGKNQELHKSDDLLEDAEIIK
jgi:hypothetical protein